MNFEELLEKYQALLVENNKLKEEIKRLKTQPDIEESQVASDEISGYISESEMLEQESTGQVVSSGIDNRSDPMEKIKLFMSLFKGRDDVYAKRWESPKKGTVGYSPSCINEWKPGLCRKPKGTCTDCTYKAYAVLDEKVVDDHLRGRKNFVAGLYIPCALMKPVIFWR